MKKILFMMIILVPMLPTISYGRLHYNTLTIKDNEIRLALKIPFRVTFDTNKLKLFTNINTGIEVLVQNVKSPYEQDYLESETRDLIKLAHPAQKDEWLNELVSYIWRTPSQEKAEYTEFKIDGILFRNDGNGRLSLAFCTQDNAEMFISSRLLQISPCLINLLYEDESESIDLNRVNSEIASCSWQFKSSTDAIVTEDGKGGFLMKGRLEFVIMPSTEIKSETGFFVEGLLNALLSLSTVFLNLGEGTRLGFENLNKPIELINSVGKSKSVTSGFYVFSNGMWRMLKSGSK